MFDATATVCSYPGIIYFTRPNTKITEYRLNHTFTLDMMFYISILGIVKALGELHYPIYYIKF